MTLTDVLSVLGPADLAALVLLLATSGLIGWRIEHPSPKRPSVSYLMADYRREWMRQYAQRESRIFDAQIIASLRQSTAFFASTALIALGAVLALVGNTAPLQGIAEELAMTDAPTLLWQIKLLIVVLFLAHAFLKFVWSHRIFGYCSVMMAATPEDPANPLTLLRATRAGELQVRAAISFNWGLRSLYFALAAIGWLAGPLALGVTTLMVAWLLWSREFTSVSRSQMTGEHLR